VPSSRLQDIRGSLCASSHFTLIRVKQNKKGRIGSPRLKNNAQIGSDGPQKECENRTNWRRESIVFWKERATRGGRRRRRRVNRDRARGRRPGTKQTQRRRHRKRCGRDAPNKAAASQPRYWLGQSSCSRVDQGKEGRGRGQPAIGKGREKRNAHRTGETDTSTRLCAPSPSPSPSSPAGCGDGGGDDDDDGD
jgi:hypothetical protein